MVVEGCGDTKYVSTVSAVHITPGKSRKISKNGIFLADPPRWVPFWARSEKFHSAHAKADGILNPLVPVSSKSVK